jgi:death-on-curing protein
LRDEGALESAVMRPQMAAHHTGADAAEQAVTLIAGIALAHAFVDGNKRTAPAAGTTFLILNGYVVRSHNHELVEQILAVIEHSGGVDEAVAALAAWIRDHLQAI